MNKNKSAPSETLTVEELLLMEQAVIGLREVALILGCSYKIILTMAKNNTFPVEDCILKLGDNKYVVVRVKLITFLTGENYEQQLEHRKRIIKERNNELRFTQEEIHKISKIIDSIDSIQ